MAWHRPGDKPLSEAMVVSVLTHICVTRPQWVNPGLDRNLLAHILSKYRSSQGVEIPWRRPRGLWFGNPDCSACFKILPMEPCVTPVIRAISTCRCPLPESLIMSCNISLKNGVQCLNFSKYKPEGCLNRLDSNEYNYSHCLSWPTTLSSNESVQLKLHEIYSQGNSLPKFIRTTPRNQLQPIQAILSQ